MPTVTYTQKDLPVRLASHIRLESTGAVTFLAGANVSSFDGDDLLDRNVSYSLAEPIPFCLVDGMELMEAKKAGSLYIASASRALILESAGAAVLLVFEYPDIESATWRAYSNCPLVQAIRSFRQL